MSSATQTLLGLYQIGKQRDQNFFDHLTFPEGIDHDLAVTNILHQAGDFEVIYPSLDFMCDACEMFSTKWQRTFEKWLAVMDIPYEPLENYNRLEAWSDSFSESELNSLSEITSLSESTSTSEYTSTSTSDETSNSATTDNDISAFNANTLQNDTSAATAAQTAGESSNESKHDTKDKHDLQNNHDSIHNHDTKNINIHRGRVHGNIGVMTTQAMYKEEWELQNLNLYDEIYRLFAREFLVPFSY